MSDRRPKLRHAPWMAWAPTLAVAALLVPTEAQALALGRLALKSGLGEPLRAEVDLVRLRADEEDSLAARLADPAAYREAGARLAAPLRELQFSLRRREDGRPYLLISGAQPLNEEAVDLIIEVEWAKGRVIRDYSLRLEGARKPPKAEPPVPAPAPAPETKTEAEAVAPAQPDHAASLRVDPASSLSGLALKRLPRGASLDQMMAALLRANPEAFINGNINKLREGAVLGVPTPDQVLALDRAEARRLLLAHSIDQAPTQPLPPPTEPVEPAPPVAVAPPRAADAEPAALAPAPAPAEPVVPTPAPPAPPPEPASASEPAPVPELPASQASATDTGAVPAPEAASAAGPTALPQALRWGLPLLLGLALAFWALRRRSPTPGAAQPAQRPVDSPPPAVSPEAQSPEALAAPSTEAPAPEPEPEQAAPLANLEPADEPAPVREPEPEPVPVREPEPEPEPALQPEPVLADRPAGQEAFETVSPFELVAASRRPLRDELAELPMQFSLQDLDAQEDVDPVAEAEVYLGYGRDLQAEEILKEALRHDPDSLPLRLKLLEIHALRRDLAAYESLARDIFETTGEDHEAWWQTQRLGAELEPGHPLYQPGGRPAAEPSARPGQVLSDAPQALGLDLDLGDEPAPALSAPQAGGLDRKLELADEFLAIGDREGATELAEEVLREGDPGQQTRARELLARLGGAR